MEINSLKIKNIISDCLIIGSGAAGLTAALNIDEKYSVNIITKSSITNCNTNLAQGGIAAVFNETDSIEEHLKDTLIAGDGICDKEIALDIISKGKISILDLIKFGTEFDKENGKIISTLEGAHSKNRVLHSNGDGTGKEIERALSSSCLSKKNINIYENISALKIIKIKNRIAGVLCYNTIKNELVIFKSNACIIATGGLGRIYKYTTNPETATGDGIAIAYNLGIKLCDMEFIQFHPTTFYIKGKRTFLISEAVRGEGGILKNINNKRFMPDYDKRAELAPRSIVSKAIISELKKTKAKNVFLDVTHFKKGFFKMRFPSINKYCIESGISPEKDLIPVIPTAHYLMGGILIDNNAKTNINGIYACGECSCTKLHGANRLASNSLLECIVYGKKAAVSSNNYLKKAKFIDINCNFKFNDTINETEIFIKYEKLKELMWENISIIRNEVNIKKVIKFIRENEYIMKDISLKYSEIQNMFINSKIICEATLNRIESRGAHYREDHPIKKDTWKIHQIIEKNYNCSI